jgi:hypothetical protein
MQIIFSLLARCHSEQATRPAAENLACARRGGIVRVSGHGLATRRRHGEDYFICGDAFAFCSAIMEQCLSWLAADLNSRCDGTLLLLFANST